MVLERNPELLGAAPPKLERVRFAVVPDAITAALELKKGSADVASNELTLDMVHALQASRDLRRRRGPGSTVIYLNFNVSDPALSDGACGRRLRCAMDRQAIVACAVARPGAARRTLLPPGHWAAASAGAWRSIRMIVRARGAAGAGGLSSRARTACGCGLS